MIETKEGVIFYFIVLFFVGSWETNCWVELDEGKSHRNGSEVLISRILHFLFSPVQFWFLSSFADRLPGSQHKSGKLGWVPVRGSFLGHFHPFLYTGNKDFSGRARRLVNVLSAFSVFSVKLPFFTWQDRDGVIKNICSLYLVIWSFFTQLILWDVKKIIQCKIPSFLLRPGFTSAKNVSVHFSKHTSSPQIQ